MKWERGFILDNLLAEDQKHKDLTLHVFDFTDRSKSELVKVFMFHDVIY